MYTGTYTKCYIKACAHRNHWSLAVLWAHYKTNLVSISVLFINKAGIPYRTWKEVLYKYQLNHNLACIYARVLHGGAACSLLFPIQYLACLSHDL